MILEAEEGHRGEVGGREREGGAEANTLVHSVFPDPPADQLSLLPRA